MNDRSFDIGGKLVTAATGNVTGDFWRMVALTDLVITSATTPNLTGSLAGQSISAGVELRLSFHALELTSGAAVLFH